MTVTVVPGDAEVTVSWAAPSSDGGRPITGYLVTAVEDTTKTCTPTPATATTCTVAGLTNGTGYSFEVVASNSIGAGTASAASASVVPTGPPVAPTAVIAVAGDEQATVRWTAPSNDGGYAITSYTVTGVPAGTCTVAAPATTCLVINLNAGNAHTFTVTATNGLGRGASSVASAPVTPSSPGPTNLPVTVPGATTNITDPYLPIVIGPDAAGGTIVLPGFGTTPVPLQVTINGQPLSVRATPGTYLRIAKVQGQDTLVLAVVNGWASMTSGAAGQPMALAGAVLLTSGAAGTRIEAQPLAVAVVSGSLVPAAGTLPELGGKGLMAGEKLLVDAAGRLVSITLGSLLGDAGQAGDGMVFVNLRASIAVDGKAFARLDGAVARLAGANLAQGLETAPTGVVLMRADGQIVQLLPIQPITIDARLPDGFGFTPLGLLRWVRGGVVVQFAPAVAELAGLATAVTTALPGATLKLGAEGVLQLGFGGATYVLRPDWTGAGTATGTPQIGVDEQGRIVFQIGQGARQLLLPALLNVTQANAIFTAALPGASLAVQPSANDGALKLTLGGQSWRLVPQWLLPAGDTGQTQPWRMGSDGLLYLKLGTPVQALHITD
ncbi:fibronectin type III domain-containing protein [Acidovorax sp.]|uniref:fibronectin type III domain-containing protein n=1 Tax=Acidovorax sp. TaxID=1872122 RepID=UPI002ACE743D|nr:fibronectin type III domain-containing protein [Acidovorax sp.]MDZ7863978.1 fibronectin type III domain-containing protein [Acidovorax sp.]